MEGYSNAGPLSPAPVGGRRHKMKKVSAKTIRRTLRKLGMKPKGRVVLKGGEGEAAATPAAPAAPSAPAGGRRKTRRSASRRSASHRGGRRHHRRSLFGLHY